jgi:hypothetical protein
MKKILQTLFVLILVAFLVFSNAYAQIDPTSPEYEQLKSSGRIPIPPQVELNVPIPTMLPAESLKSAQTNTSSLLIPLDISTFTFLDRNDDSYTSQIILPFGFDFYGTIRNSCWINNNGNISFDGPYFDYTATGFPVAAYPMLAPFWADVDTRNPASGVMWYKVEPHRVVVIWDAVGYYSIQADKLNTFELIFTDGTDPLIGIGNNVAFSYGDMQWTTGSASLGSGGFGGVPATVGVNKGDGTTFALVGRFDHEGTDYDGPGGIADGVSYLDNKNFFFNTSTQTNNNIPPVASGFPASPVIINVGEVWNRSVQFLSPEIGQTTTTVVNDNGLSDVGYPNTTSGSVSQINMQITGTNSNLGSHTIAFTATDNGTPAGVTTVYLEIIVVCENPGKWLGFNSDWNDASNWCGGLPNATTNVTIPSGVTQPVIGVSVSAYCKDITIAGGATLTIESNATGTGSLIISGIVSGAGSASVQRYMTTDAWHIVASPVSGQSIAGFLGSNPNIAEDDVVPSIRGMMAYNPVVNDWKPYFTNDTEGDLETGKGFSMRTNDNIEVTFAGKLQSGNQTATGLASGLWNCVGNPYTSAIGINEGSSSTDDFLTANASNLDPSYGAIYIWDNPDANNGVWGLYTIISNVNSGYAVQQGQAFMVKMNSDATATTVGFTSGMQIHNPALELKSANGDWAIIKLQASINSQKSSTTIAFNNRMTKGLDVTYDAGLLRGGADLVLYSKLVEDNGIPFAIQALPDNNFGSMIIPLGIESMTGGEVVFSSENMNLPSTCQIILEDKVSKTFTDLSISEYATTVAANSSVSDRFRIHTSYLTTKLDNGSLVANLSAYAIRNVEIRVKGEVSKQAIATLYDLQGRVILVKTLDEGSLNVIRTPNIKTAVYTLFIKDCGKLRTFKIPVIE